MSPDEPPPIGPRPLVDEAPVVHDEPLTDEDEARVVGEEASLDLGDEPDALPVGPGPLDHAPFPTSEPPVGDAAAEPSAEAPFPTHASHPTDAPLPAPPSDPTDAPFPGRGHDPADEDPSLFVDSLDPLAREAPDMGPEAAGGMDPLATQPHGVPGLSEEEDEDDDEALGAGQPALLDEDELAVFEEEHEDPPAGAVPPALDDESDEALLEEDSVVGGAYEDPVDEDVVGADEDYADEDTVGSGAFEDPVDEAPDFLPEPEPERRPASPPRDPDAFDFDA